jgi:hypothetical protein
MISNSRMQMTLLSFLLKKFSIVKKGNPNKDTLKLYAVLFHYTQRSAFKTNNTSIFKTNLPSLTSAPLPPSLADSNVKI